MKIESFPFVAQQARATGSSFPEKDIDTPAKSFGANSIRDAVVVDLSPVAIAALEDSGEVKFTKGNGSSGGDGFILNAFDPLPPAILKSRIPGPTPFETPEENEVIPAPKPFIAPGRDGIKDSPRFDVIPTEDTVPAPKPFIAPGRDGIKDSPRFDVIPAEDTVPAPAPAAPTGKDAIKESPGFEARKAISEHPELGSRPFGQIVSLVARGLPLPVEKPPLNDASEAPPVDTIKEVLNPAQKTKSLTSGISALVPRELDPISLPPANSDDQLIRELLA